MAQPLLNAAAMNNHHTFRKLSLSFVGAAAAFVLWGCEPGGTSTLHGRATDDVGSQQQALSAENFGGAATASSVTSVRASSLNADGTLTVIAEAKLQSDGSYDLEVPSGDKRVIVEALDASGKVRASTIASFTGSSGETVRLSPLTTETSVEAQVLVQMVAQGVSVAEANAVDVRARINASTAAAVRASSDSEAKIKALAEAVAAAERAQIRAYQENGVQTSQSALFEASVRAAVTLDSSLDAASSAEASATAYENFLTSVHAQWKEAAANERNASRGERAASAAFRATVRARLQVSGQAADPVADAAIRSASSLEARVTTSALAAALTAAGAGDATVDAAASASTQLRTSLSASTSAAASASAYAAFRTALVGNGDVSGSVLGNYLAVNVATKASVDTAVSASATAAAQLDAALNTAFAASIQASQKIDFTAFAEKISAAYKAYDAQVLAQTTALSGFGSKANVAAEVMLQAEGSLRASE